MSRIRRPTRPLARLSLLRACERHARAHADGERAAEPHAHVRQGVVLGGAGVRGLSGDIQLHARTAPSTSTSYVRTGTRRRGENENAEKPMRDGWFDVRSGGAEPGAGLGRMRNPARGTPRAHRRTQRQREHGCKCGIYASNLVARVAGVAWVGWRECGRVWCVSPGACRVDSETDSVGRGAVTAVWRGGAGVPCVRAGAWRGARRGAARVASRESRASERAERRDPAPRRDAARERNGTARSLHHPWSGRPGARTEDRYLSSVSPLLVLRTPVRDS